MRRQADTGFANRAAVRRAFTLVEILVVVAVIGILLTVIALASVRALAGARVQQTRSTIKKIDEMLSRRTAAFERAMTGRNLAGGNATESELLRKYDHIPDSPLKNKQLTVKFFGQTFGEPVSHSAAANVWYMADLGRLDASGVPVSGSELDVLASPPESKFDPTKHKRETESAEMLYWTLVNGPTFGADVVEADSFNSSEVADTDGDGLMEFIDAWGKPLRFYRWPTRVLRPGPPNNPTAQGSPYQPLGPATGGKLNSDAPATFLIASLPSYTTTGDTSDPRLLPGTPLGEDNQDTYGDVLEAWSFNKFGQPTAQLTAAQLVTLANTFEQTFHTINTWHAPLIVSTGPDGLLGLYEPHDGWYGRLAQPMANTAGTAYSEALQDNVTNLNGQASGTGGQ